MPLPISLPITEVHASLAPVWVGTNPEVSDYNNPNGDIYRDRYVVTAVTAAGRRFNHQTSFETEPVGLVARVKAAGNIDLNYWVETYEVYGSAAWQAADAEREFVHQSNPATAGTVRDF